MVIIIPLSRGATPGSPEQADSPTRPTPGLGYHFPHTAKESWLLHLVLHFKPRALPGQAHQLPALLVAAGGWGFSTLEICFWKDFAACLADHLQGDCASVSWSGE